jgi:hypothetical protein
MATGRLAASPVILTLLLGLAACGPSQPQQTGVVLRVDSPALGQVDSLDLLTKEGTVLTFDTTELAFSPDFPPSHVAEHQVLGEPIRVTYRTDGDRLVATQLEDAG